jgi:hypothetical protein
MKTTLSESSHKSQKRPRIIASPPEYGDARDVQRVFGVKESLLYHLWKEGAVKAILVKGTGRTRGKRLFDFHSIRKLLKEAATEAKV